MPFWSDWAAIGSHVTQSFAQSSQWLLVLEELKGVRTALARNSRSPRASLPNCAEALNSARSVFPRFKRPHRQESEYLSAIIRKRLFLDLQPGRATSSAARRRNHPSDRRYLTVAADTFASALA